MQCTTLVYMLILNIKLQVDTFLWVGDAQWGALVKQFCRYTNYCGSINQNYDSSSDNKIN